MQPRLGMGFIGLALALAVAGVAAEEDFSRAVRPEDFAAAGLAKLSPQELAQLDALVREFRRGALTEAERKAEAAARAKADAEARATHAETEARAAKAQAAQQKQADEGRLAKVKAMLPARTVVATEPLESRIVGKFTGWQERTVFVLENGERWRVANTGESYYSPAIMNPKIKIVPGAFGAFWMIVEDIDQRVKVVPLSR